jgi:outer membrane lipoprotein-sorting protein
VGALGDILVLAHDASERARPATLTVTEWSHGPRSAAAFDRFMAAQHGAAYAVTQSIRDEPAPEESSWTTTLAFESPIRFRESSAGKQARKRYLVRDGDRWLSWDADWGAASDETEGEGRAPSPPYAFLLDPFELVSTLRLEPAGTTEVAGRAAARMRATPRDRTGGGGAIHGIGAGADGYELALDMERGVLLRCEASLEGKPFHRLEVSDIVFGPIDARTFEVAVPEGAEQPAGWFRPERLELLELAAAAPFAVFVPAEVPAGWRLVERLLTPAHERPRVDPAVSLLYASREGAYEVNIHERAVGSEHRDWLTWRREGDLEVADAGEDAAPRHHVRVVRKGTVVELSGGDPALLAGLARSLVPAPADPPRL